MEVKLVQKEKNERVSFIIKDSNPAFVNALRRTIIEEVPTMAVEEVEIKKNNSLLYDEMVAHRIGLLPLTTDIKAYTLPSECKCEGKGCARCQLNLSLKTKGPSTVYASDLKSKDPKVKPVFPKTIIVKLQKGQSLEIEATAQLGIGKNHVKWSPGHIFYRQKPVVEISKDPQDKDAIVEACPQIFHIKNNKLEVIKENVLKYDVVEAGVEACKDNSIKVTYSNDFIFTIESWGQLPCKKIMQEAIKRLSAQMKEFSDKLKDLK